MNAEILIHKTGQDLMIGFNPKFLSDALRVIDDEEVTLYMMNPKSPCFIKDEEESYIYLILPVNFNAAASNSNRGQSGKERRKMESINLRDEYIKLGQALKACRSCGIRRGRKVCDPGRTCKGKWGS